MSITESPEARITDALRTARQRVKTIALPVRGVVQKYSGQVLHVSGCNARLGEVCRVTDHRGRSVEATVTGFDHNLSTMVALDAAAIRPGASVVPSGRSQRAPVGYGLIGRVVDSCGKPLDEMGVLQDANPQSLEPSALNPLERQPITEVLDVGVRAINAVLTVGRGQRIGLLAASGLGKSVLLGMMARHTAADITVVCLLGERGREVQEFVQNILGPEGLRTTVVIAIPADHTPLRRLNGARYASAVAEFFRDRGHHVLLLMDSLTRYAHAGREVGLANGEFPVTGGYPPSVFTDLPVLLERGGNTSSGSVTAIYTLLMENSDRADPLADAAKAILDGHIVLSRELAETGHYPAIDILASISRLAGAVTDSDHQQAMSIFIRLYSCYQQNKDLLSLGMYQRGDNPELDLAIDLMPAMDSLLVQGATDQHDFNSSRDLLTQTLSHVVSGTSQ